MSDLIQLTRETFNELVAERDGARREREGLRAEVDRLRERVGVLFKSRELEVADNHEIIARLRAENDKIRSDEALLDVAGAVVKWAYFQKGVTLNEYSVRDIIGAEIARQLESVSR